MSQYTDSRGNRVHPAVLQYERKNYVSDRRRKKIERTMTFNQYVKKYLGYAPVSDKEARA
jgi:hypothetical protein